MSAVKNRHGSFQHFTNNFRKNNLWFTSSTADRGKELLEANMSADSKSLGSSFYLIRVVRPPPSTHNPFSSVNRVQLTSNFCCSRWWLRVSGPSFKIWFLSSKIWKLSKHCTAEMWIGRTSFICQGVVRKQNIVFINIDIAQAFFAILDKQRNP